MSKSLQHTTTSSNPKHHHHQILTATDQYQRPIRPRQDGKSQRPSSSTTVQKCVTMRWKRCSKPHHLTAGAPGRGGAPRSPACWLSISAICCSRSISIINGTTKIKKVVPAIHAAFPVLHSSFWLNREVLDAALRAFSVILEPDTLKLMPRPHPFPEPVPAPAPPFETAALGGAIAETRLSLEAQCPYLTLVSLEPQKSGAQVTRSTIGLKS